MSEDKMVGVRFGMEPAGKLDALRVAEMIGGTDYREQVALQRPPVGLGYYVRFIAPDEAERVTALLGRMVDMKRGAVLKVSMSAEDAATAMAAADGLSSLADALRDAVRCVS